MAQPGEVSRRCLAHMTIRCTKPECVSNEADLLANPNRKRPQATPGAPEVSWGAVGIVRKERNGDAQVDRSEPDPSPVGDEPNSPPADLVLGLARMRMNMFNRPLSGRGKE